MRKKGQDKMLNFTLAELTSTEERHVIKNHSEWERMELGQTAKSFSVKVQNNIE